MATVHGFYDDRFAAMAEVLSANVDSGADLGASVAVTIDGEFVVDMWAGWADPGKTTSWGKHTQSPTSGRQPKR